MYMCDCENGKNLCRANNGNSSMNMTVVDSEGFCKFCSHAALFVNVAARGQSVMGANTRLTRAERGYTPKERKPPKKQIRKINEESKVIGKILRNFRAGKEMTVIQMATAMGFSQGSLTNMESGRRNFSKRAKNKINELYNLGVE